MKKKTGILSKIYIAILLIFLYSPIAVLIFYSFNNGKTTVWKGFTFKWYVQLFRHQQFQGKKKNAYSECVKHSDHQP